MWTRKTLRKMTPLSREIAKDLMQIQRAVTRLERKVELVDTLSRDYHADECVLQLQHLGDVPRHLRCHGCGFLIQAKPSEVISGLECPQCTAPVILWQVSEIPWDE